MADPTGTIHGGEKSTSAADASARRGWSAWRGSLVYVLPARLPASIAPSCAKGAPNVPDTQPYSDGLVQASAPKLPALAGRGVMQPRIVPGHGTGRPGCAGSVPPGGCRSEE